MLNFILSLFVISFAGAQSLQPSMGTGEVQSMVLNWDNCEIEMSSYSLDYRTASGEPLVNTHGPFRICYPNEELLSFSETPHLADPDSPYLILRGQFENNHWETWNRSRRPFFVITKRPSEDNILSAQLREISLAINGGLAIVQGEPVVQIDGVEDQGIGLESSDVHP